MELFPSQPVQASSFLSFWLCEYQKSLVFCSKIITLSQIVVLKRAALAYCLAEVESVFFIDRVQTSMQNFFDTWTWVVHQWIWLSIGNGKFWVEQKCLVFKWGWVKRLVHKKRCTRSRVLSLVIKQKLRVADFAERNDHQIRHLSKAFKHYLGPRGAGMWTNQS